MVSNTVETDDSSIVQGVLGRASIENIENSKKKDVEKRKSKVTMDISRGS